jgi:hypothetical protein
VAASCLTLRDSAMPINFNVGLEPLCEELKVARRQKNGERLRLYVCQKRKCVCYPPLRLKARSIFLDGKDDTNKILESLKTCESAINGNRIHFTNRAYSKVVSTPELWSIYETIAPSVVAVYVGIPHFLAGVQYNNSAVQRMQRPPVFPLLWSDINALATLFALSADSCVELHISNFRITTDISQILCTTVALFKQLKYLSIGNNDFDQASLSDFLRGLHGKLPALRYFIVYRLQLHDFVIDLHSGREIHSEVPWSDATNALEQLIVGCTKLVYLGLYNCEPCFASIKAVMGACEEHPSIQVFALRDITYDMYAPNIIDAIRDSLASGRSPLLDIDFGIQDRQGHTQAHLRQVKNSMNKHFFINKEKRQVRPLFESLRSNNYGIRQLIDALAEIGTTHEGLDYTYAFIRDNINCTVVLMNRPKPSRKRTFSNTNV